MANLVLVSTVHLPAVSRFVAAEQFGPNNSDGIEFSIRDNFRQYFFPKVEENIPAATLNIHWLNKYSSDQEIRTEIGTEQEETALAYVYELIKKQKNGENGHLLTNCCKNIFHIRDINENLCAISVSWGIGRQGWLLGVDSGGWDPDMWFAGGWVFSRKKV